MEGSIEQLLTIDPAGLDLDDRLAHLDELNTFLMRVSARRERALAAVATPDDERNWIREEVGCLLRWPFAAAADRLARAVHLTTKAPAALAAHEAGLISDDHTRVLAEATYGLDDATIAEVESRVLGRAPTQTRAQFRASVRRAVVSADPRGGDARHEDAVRRDKTVRLHPLPDGMAGIWSAHVATDAAAIMVRLRALTADRAPDDSRTADARRADALADCVLGGVERGRVAAAVHLVVPCDVASGASDGPGELVGVGPVPAVLCRRVLADPGTIVTEIRVDGRGTVVPHIESDDRPTSYRPSARLARHIVAN